MDREPVIDSSERLTRRPDSLIAIYAGEAECYSAPRLRVARVYAGLDEWGLSGG
ncbi:hypothetical protein [Nocardia xishanensis]